MWPILLTEGRKVMPSLFIDLHTHMLPGLDDGAQTMEDALGMAKVAWHDGITTVVATPHMSAASPHSKADLITRVDALNRELSEHGIGIAVLPGAEYAFEPDLPQRLAAGKLLTINDKGIHLLIEFPSLLIPENTEQTLFQIQLQGVTPVIAHPERNYTFSNYPNLLEGLIRRGMLAQVTSASLTGWFGSEVRNTALKFIKLGLIHCIASDGHTNTGRAPVLRQAYVLIRRKWGQEYAQTLVCDNPARIINGQTVETSSSPRRQSIWSRLSTEMNWG